MSSVNLKWGDGEYEFELKSRQIEELQRLSGVGIGELTERVFSGRFWLVDIVETIRLGLIGGGVAPVKAKQLIDTYVDGQPLANPSDPSSPLKTALAILSAAFLGIEELKPEEGEDSEGELKAAELEKAL